MNRLEARPAALSRHTAPDYVLIAGLELIQLRKLSDLAFRLFVELVAMADHVTGDIKTSRSVLLSLLDHDKTPHAAPRPKATPKGLRTALADLAGQGLIRSKAERNQAAKALFLNVPNRMGLSASIANRGRNRGRPQNGVEQPNPRLSKGSKGQQGPKQGPGVQENTNTPLPPLVIPVDKSRRDGYSKPSELPEHIAAPLRVLTETLRIKAMGKNPKK